VAPPQGQPHPGRQLAVLAGLFVVLYLLVFFGAGASGSVADRLHPKLGLDLVGGTRVVLEGRNLANGVIEVGWDGDDFTFNPAGVEAVQT